LVAKRLFDRGDQAARRFAKLNVDEEPMISARYDPRAPAVDRLRPRQVPKQSAGRVNIDYLRGLAP
jgi:hypothetical protein